MINWWREIWQTATLEQATLMAGLITFGGGLLAFLGVIATILVTARHSKRALAEQRRREADAVKRDVLIGAAEAVADLHHKMVRSVIGFKSADAEDQALARREMRSAHDQFDVITMKLLMFGFDKASGKVIDLNEAIDSWVAATVNRSDPEDHTGAAVYATIADTLDMVTVSLKSLE
ncbi:hypothetical protein [Rhodococcus sp. NPDC055024]